MRYIMLIVLIAVGALLLHSLLMAEMEESGNKKKLSPSGVVSDLVKSGRKVGRKSSDAFEGLSFDRKK